MRNTPLLKAVLSHLEKTQRPVSVVKMLEVLRVQNLNPNKTTLYRMFEKLEKAKVVESFVDSKITLYGLKTDDYQTPFRCQYCDAVHYLDDPEVKSQIQDLEKTLKHKGFEVGEHHFSLTGKCTTCN